MIKKESVARTLPRPTYIPRGLLALDSPSPVIRTPPHPGRLLQHVDAPRSGESRAGGAGRGGGRLAALGFRADAAKPNGRWGGVEWTSGASGGASSKKTEKTMTGWAVRACDLRQSPLP